MANSNESLDPLRSATTSTGSRSLEMLQNQTDIYVADQIHEQNEDIIDDESEDVVEEVDEDDNEDDEDDDEDEEDDDDIEPASFLRRLIQSRANARFRREDLDESIGAEGDDDEDDDDIDENDPRAEFLRAISALSDGDSSRMSERGSGFVDVMQRLVGGGIMFGGGRESSEMDALISTLNQRDDTYIVLETLNELSERLLMMNGITAERIIPANKLAKSLISIMEDPLLENDLELHLVACRCLYNFLEVNQDFIHPVLDNNAIEALCKKLLEIKYIDLTEQALQTLEMISRDPISHNQIIANNGLKACLQFLDFLTVHAQRKCLTIVSNSCSNISIENFQMVKDVFSNIAEVVKVYTDALVVENAWLAISGIVTSFKLKPDFLEELFALNPSLLKQLCDVVVLSCNKSLNTKVDNVSSSVTLNYSICLSMIKSLIILSSISVKLSTILLEDCALGEVIVKSLNKYSKTKSAHDDNIDDLAPENISHNESVSIEGLMAAPKELLAQFLTLIGYLLPIVYTASDSPFLFDDHVEFKERQLLNESRIDLYKSGSSYAYWKFVNEIWSLLMNSFQATMDFEVRKKVFICLIRIVTFNTTGEDFKKIKDVELITNLLASVTNQSKASIFKDYQQSSQSKLFSKVEDDDIDMLSSEDERAQNEDSYDSEGSDFEEALEQVAHKLSSNSKIKDSSTINSNLLLLSSLIVTKNCMKLAPQTFIPTFEREGLINDTLTIMECLKDSANNEKSDESKTKLHPIFSYTNKYVDFEFSNEYQYNFTNDKLLSKIGNVAREIDAESQSVNSSGIPVNIPQHMKILEEITITLNNPEVITKYDFDEWKKLWSKLKFALNGGTRKIQVSSFELISSKIIEALTHVFTSDEYDFAFEFNDCYKAFVSEFFLDGGKDSPVSFLISKLQEALTRSESFEIITSGGNNVQRQSLYQSENSQTTIMAKQVKLKLSADDESSASAFPSNLQNMILSVHAIATFKSVDTFIKQRFKFLEELGGIGEKSDPFASEEASVDDKTEESKEIAEDTNNQDDIEFLINGEVVPNEITIYGAIYRSLQSKTDEIIDPSKIWSTIHNVSFRKVSGASRKEDKFTSQSFVSTENELEIYDTTTLNILKLLKVLFEMHNFVKNNISSSSSIDQSSFMNWKLTVKLNRQLEEPLVVASGTLPGWSIHSTTEFPFIFPLETRMFFLQSTSFGYSRLIHHWQIRTKQATGQNENSSHTNNQRSQLGRPTRHKVRLSRKMILQSAVKVLGLYGSAPGILEIEYFDEVGSGLGPTLEFYATVSKEFSKKKLKLWRDSDPIDKDEEAYVVNKLGLFPSPLSKSQISSENGRKVLYFFASLGKFVARALLDSRIIDFNFNQNFLKLVQFFNTHGTQKHSGRELKKLANLPCLKLVDSELADSIEHLVKYTKLYAQVDEKDRANIRIDGCTIRDLSLYFELPGYPDYELIPGGSEVQVTEVNLEQYINRVIEATLYTGILHQTKAFMEGFSKVFPIKSLVIFSPKELVDLFGNAEEDWSFDSLTSAINANHGYTKESNAIESLVNILVNFSVEQKRTFLQFLTGAPKLPIGGFKSLRPELTVVRKCPEDGLSDDDYLPSVMTCANYLKLPSYSSEKVMKERLLTAINEGAGAFLLS